jgi:hypothetical protein
MRRETAALPNVPDTEAPHWILKLDFVGANPDVKISGKEQDQTTFSYFHGGKESWRAGLKTYRSIVYHELWPGIDLVYTGTADKMKYEFVVQPGADPAQIKLAYRGASSIKLNPSGQLEVTTQQPASRTKRHIRIRKWAGGAWQSQQPTRSKRKRAAMPKPMGSAWANMIPIKLS